MTPLQRLGDPLPAERLVVDGPDQEGSRRVGQFGQEAGELAVKIARPVLLMMGPVRDRHDRAVPGGQPHRDVAVVVQGGRRDIPGADQFGTLLIGDPHLAHVPARLVPPGTAAGSPVAARSVPVRRASTSPTVRSWLVGSGSGRCAWMW